MRCKFGHLVFPIFFYLNKKRIMPSLCRVKANLGLKMRNISVNNKNQLSAHVIPWESGK